MTRDHEIELRRKFEIISNARECYAPLRRLLVVKNERNPAETGRQLPIFLIQMRDLSKDAPEIGAISDDEIKTINQNSSSERWSALRPLMTRAFLELLGRPPRLTENEADRIFPVTPSGDAGPADEPLAQLIARRTGFEPEIAARLPGRYLFVRHLATRGRFYLSQLVIHPLPLVGEPWRFTVHGGGGRKSQPEQRQMEGVVSFAPQGEGERLFLLGYGGRPKGLRLTILEPVEIPVDPTAPGLSERRDLMGLRLGLGVEVQSPVANRIWCFAIPEDRIFEDSDMGECLGPEAETRIGSRFDRKGGVQAWLQDAAPYTLAPNDDGVPRYPNGWRHDDAPPGGRDRAARRLPDGGDRV